MREEVLNYCGEGRAGKACKNDWRDGTKIVHLLRLGMNGHLAKCMPLLVAGAERQMSQEAGAALGPLEERRLPNSADLSWLPAVSCQNSSTIGT